MYEAIATVLMKTKESFIAIKELLVVMREAVRLGNVQ